MLNFKQETIYSLIVMPNGETAKRPIEIRTHPITGRTCRITYSRSEESEPGAEALPAPPPFAGRHDFCPFCRARLDNHTPMLPSDLYPQGRMKRGTSVLFPNLFPYGRYSAVSLFDDGHFVEIGTASAASYTDSFVNCRDYLLLLLDFDPAAVHMAITQNHLPSAGGSLLHPHLQVQADRVPSNHQRFLKQHVAGYHCQTGNLIFSDYLRHEKETGDRFIGKTGDWEWLAAFAPEGFYEIWGILPEITSLRRTTDDHWKTLAAGVLSVQKFYRSLGRNGYNLGLLLLEDGTAYQELRVIMTVRSNYAQWVRSDFTGFEVMLGDMATFTSPEETAQKARPFWK
ncbi:MAG: galactose-1-phosphate uridylyltransferase [Desulfobacterales bacterium]|nr:galactose-1-phosphate uridylyltransferase [Desulfobacterales bacterium]